VGNVFIESFKGPLRDECLSTSWFLDLVDARAQLEAWCGLVRSFVLRTGGVSYFSALCIVT
jgi:hypothetical protein